MSKLQVGRFGADVLSGEVQSLSDDGAKMSISGITAYADADEGTVLRQQLLGLLDESFVPVLWEEQPELAGFYRPTASSVNGDRSLAHQGVWDFTVELERVGGFSAPLIEVRGRGTTRVNTQSVTPLAAHGVPAAARSWLEYDPDLNVYWAVTPSTRQSATGDVAWRNSEEPFKQYFVDPESFYDGAATLHMGPLEAAVVGRQVRNEPDEWVLSNGLIRVRPEYTSSVFGLRLSAWTGAGWGADWLVELLGGAPTRSQLPAPHTITVLRNSPEEVRLRFTSNLPASRTTVFVDMRIRRGVRFVEFRMSSNSGANQPGVNTTGFGSATDLAGGWGNGTQVVGGPLNIGKTGSTMYAYESSVAEVPMWDFCLGVLPTSGTTTDMNNLIREYMWSVNEVQTVVAR